ncbi:MAG TPA: lipopolysaccharide assembly protein LapA domain-containing protein [Gammaproteobacteria bacterium]|nr:lipopolysaccharide assembly protein LapA domain-containing protein [Gammaproteobacteria bacterium]
MVRLLKLIVWLLLVALGWLLYSRNPGPVVFDYYVGHIEWPLSVLMAASLLAGAVLAALASLWPLFKLKRQNWRLRRQLRRSQVAALPPPTSPAGSNALR